jgi:hypothetical protein
MHQSVSVAMAAIMATTWVMTMTVEVMVAAVVGMAISL